MQPTPLATTKTGRAALTVRHVLGVLVAVLLVLVQAVPGVAGHDGGAASWIEICSDDGAEFIPTPTGNLPADCDCDRCDCCLMRIDVQALDVAKPIVAIIRPGCSAATVQPGADLVCGAAEKLWPEKRGPPETKKSKDMTSLRSTRPTECGSDVTDLGACPCV